MSFKCPVHLCERTFSQRTAYRQHVQICITKTEPSSNSDSESNSENNTSEVFILFLI